MSRDFVVEGAVKVKVHKKYPWPCQDEPFRTLELFTDDVLTKNPETGKYTCHTGLCCINIILRDDEVEPWGRDVTLRML
jgi:hypothetical protein